MIDRLLELKLSDFRCFSGEKTIPLDANVVLIHGTNGTGKTSLLSALEFALTGRVEELAAFSSDYPRCLKNIRGQKSAKASVRFLANNQQEATVAQDADASASTALPREEARFFRDRCYLSQSSLGRLLEAYQASSKDSPEQPLVRFVRELLGLDLLENLTAGLHEAGNITRIEKTVPALAKAREDYSSLGVKIEKLNADLTTTRANWQQALTNVQQVIAEAGDPMPAEPWTLEGLIKRIDAHRTSTRQSSGNLQQYRTAQGRLQHAAVLLAVNPNAPQPGKLRDQLQKIESRQQTLTGIFEPLLGRAEMLLRNRGGQTMLSGDVATRLEAADTAMALLLKRRKAEDEALAQTGKEIGQIRDRLEVIGKEMNEIAPAQESFVSISQRWAGVLGSVLEHIKGEECPVCGRDYSELSRGELRKHVIDEISRLGADAKRIEEMVQRREKLAAEQATLSRRLGAIDSQYQTDRLRQEKEIAQQAELEKLTAEIAALVPIRSEWGQNLALLIGIRNELTAAETQERQRREAAIGLEEISKTIALPEDVRHSDPGAFATAAGEFIGRQAEIVEKQVATAGRLRETMDQAKAFGEALQKMERELADCVRRQHKAQTIETGMRADLDSARSLSKAAMRAKTRLLEQVFNEKLNKLWRELFIRLVKDEQFHPRLADPETVRGLIRTTIEGCRDGIEPFKQFAAIASSGNLNTAALSLFLSLNLIEQPRHRFLVLDDPVQAMDDVHVVQLANLLREIRRQAQRQIIVAVHEKALFDYLRLELGPIDRHTSLRTVELIHPRRDAAPDIDVHHYTWKADKIQFGA